MMLKIAIKRTSPTLHAEATKVSFVKMPAPYLRTAAPREAPAMPTTAAQDAARRVKVWAALRLPEVKIGGSFVVAAAAIGSAHSATNANTLMMTLYAATITTGCVLFTKADMQAYIDKTHITTAETGK
mmetsp:Transcript_73060/g.136503  ORF Transcript_73060/g.136503 Transcript_73060/m.136503 type:complete len:128 (+) Transcript_73060:414-797(+)